MVCGTIEQSVWKGYVQYGSKQAGKGIPAEKDDYPYNTRYDSASYVSLRLSCNKDESSGTRDSKDIPDKN